MSRNLLVIGGNGFIGSHVVRRAVSDGWSVTILDSAAARSTLGLASADTPEFRPADIGDKESLTAALDGLRPDAAVSLAAYGLGADGLARGAAANPALAVRVNVEGLVNLVGALGDAGCGTLVHSSSSTVYAATGPDGVREDAALHPDSVYGATKLAAEHVARVLGGTCGIRVASARLPLVYGEGRWYGGSQDDLVRFADDLAHGEHSRLAGWTSAADWMYATDAAGCLLALAEAQRAVGSYNVSGHRSSLHQLAHALVEATGSGDRATVEAAPDGGPSLPLMDTSRIADELGYRPGVDTAERGAALYAEALARRDRRSHA
ncbi:MAG: NAD-dependent epimerase/dehydratase family protein [Nocardioidaceae bacterium]